MNHKYKDCTMKIFNTRISGVDSGSPDAWCCPLLLLVFFCAPIVLNAQISNDNINIHAIAAVYGWNNATDDGANGESEVVFRAKALADNNGVATDLLNNGAATDICVTFQADCEPFCGILRDEEVYKTLDASAKKFDLTVQSWEDDSSTPGCPPDAGDDNVADASYLVDVQSLEPYSSQWETESFSIGNNSSMSVDFIWRFAAGNTWNDPLDFGIIDDGEARSHINSNIPRGSSKFDSELFYTNQYGSNLPSGQVSPDVHYKFSISGNAKQVTISTDNSGTLFLTSEIHLLKYYGTNDVEYIAHDGYSGPGTTAELVQNLCEGDYIVVVEGSGSSYGVFELSIDVEDMPPSVISPGTIETTTVSLCEGVDLPDIVSTMDAASGIHGLYGDEVDDSFEGYEWQKRISDGGVWTTVSNEFDSDLAATGNMGMEDISFRRRVTFCGVTSEWSNIVTIPFNPSTVLAGSIAFVGDLSFREGFDPGIFQNEVTGSGNPTPISYQWEMSTNNRASWEEIAGATNVGYDVGTLDESTIFRRVATNGCGKQELSNDIELEAIPANGVISGKITAPPLGFGTGVADIEVCAVPQGTLDGAVTECDTTNSNGEYQITDLYYGTEGLTYRVIPILEGHEIRINETSEDSTIDKTLTTNVTTQSGVNFVDLTAFTLSGNVYQSFFDGSVTEQFGKSKVVIYLKDENSIKTAEDTTDAHGNYSIIIPNAGNWTIIPELKEPLTPGNQNPHEHIFSPMEQNIVVSQNVENVDFEDVTTMQISGFVGAGCNNYLGTVGLRFSQDPNDGFFNKILTTSLNSGTFNFNLPARNYQVSIDESSISLQDDSYDLADVKTQFAQFTFEADLTHSDTTFEVFYRAPLSILLEGVPEGPECGTFDFFLVEQGINYPNFEITIYDGPVSRGCPLDTGSITITDEIGNREQEEIPISQGQVEFVMIGGSPNIVAPHLKSLFLNAQSLNPAVAAMDTQLQALVTGERPRESTFVTVSPEIPLLVLHDPPGDQSYSYVIKDSTYQTSLRNYRMTTDEIGGWADVRYGTAIGLSTGIGTEISYDIEAWGQIGGNYTTTEQQISSTESIVSITTTNEYQTPSSEDFFLLGGQGDVFVGGAFNFIYALTDVVFFDADGCMVDTDVSLALDPDSLATTFIKTKRGIENTINELRQLIDINPDSAIYYQNQINVWESTLEENRRRKEEVAMDPGLKIGNYTTDGGTVFRQEVTSTTSDFSTTEFLMEIDSGVALEAKLSFGATGINGGFLAQFKTETGGSRDTNIVKSFTAGFTLEDNDADDKITVDVYQDPVYKTPIFIPVSGLSSCPYEGEFLPLDQFEVNYDPMFPPSVSNIDPNVGVTYRLNVTNTGDFTRTYMVSSDHAYNQDGAIVMIQGLAAGVPAELSIDPDQTIAVTITVDKAPSSNVFSYPNLQINIEPQCQLDGDLRLREIRQLSAFYISNCSNISMFAPNPGTIVNSSTGNLDIWMKDYDKSKIDRVVLEYARSGLGNWQPSAGVDLSVNDLSDLASGTIVSWNTEEIQEDGTYELRLKVICGSGVNYSTLTPIIVDRKSPVVFGLPSPIDDIYDQSENDQISVSYDEEVDCSDGLSLILDLVSGDTLSASLSCFENTVTVVPDFSLGARPPSAYRVVLSGISDLHGNNADIYRWVFIVGDFDFNLLTCLPDLTISNNNQNQNAINVTNYSALTITSDGTIPGFGTTTYQAEEEIILAPGFEVTIGGALDAIIEECVDDN